MCSICGKFLRSDTLKKHIIAKHGNKENCEQHQEKSLMVLEGDGKESRYDQEISLCDNKIESVQFSIGSTDVKLDNELLRDKEAYLKNVLIGEKILLRISEGKIPEESLSKQHKFCLELYRSQ